jgi:hypothetical protein
MDIYVFNSAYGHEGGRNIALADVNVVRQQIDYTGKPYIMFEHKDFPLGLLRADFDGDRWTCDLD